MPIRKLSNGLFVAGEGESAAFVAFIPDASGRIRMLHMNMRAYVRQ